LSHTQNGVVYYRHTRFTESIACMSYVYIRSDIDWTQTRKAMSLLCRSMVYQVSKDQRIWIIPKVLHDESKQRTHRVLYQVSTVYTNVLLLLVVLIFTMCCYF